MIDERSKKTISTLLPEVQTIFTSFLQLAQITAAKKGYQYIAIQGTRTWAEQERLYAQGRTQPGKIVTNAKPGYSYHNFGLSIDCGVFKNGKYIDSINSREAIEIHKLLSPICGLYGLRWGGNFTKPDYPHYEYKYSPTLTEMREMHNSGIPIKIKV